jgi:hypothetical protein
MIRQTHLKNLVVAMAAMLSSHLLCAQVTNTGLADTTGGERIGKIAIGAYLDAYYGYHFGQPTDGNVPYMVSMSRHNEWAVNLACIDVRYSGERLRARIVPGFGTYVNANYAQEPASLRNLIEANMGIKLSAKRDIWLDVGVLGSPYTNESAFSRDHLMYTRSFAPEYVPYYLSGAKLSVPLGKKLNMYVYLLNGWQQIQDNNPQKALGTQLEYRPTDKDLLNWDTFIGDERSDTNPDRRMRYFTDLYWIHNPSGKFTLTACTYIGWQQRLDARGQALTHVWWQANVIGRYRFHKNVSLSGRLEYFDDPKQVQIVSQNLLTDGFNSYSTGLCLNVSLFEKAMFRLEGRHFFSPQQVYSQNNTPARSSTWVIGNLTIAF